MRRVERHAAATQREHRFSGAILQESARKDGGTRTNPFMRTGFARLTHSSLVPVTHARPQARKQELARLENSSGDSEDAPDGDNPTVEVKPIGRSCCGLLLPQHWLCGMLFGRKLT